MQSHEFKILHPFVHWQMAGNVVYLNIILGNLFPENGQPNTESPLIKNLERAAFRQALLLSKDGLCGWNELPKEL